jgi:hypothetical protein
VVKKIDSGEVMEMELPREQVRLRHSLPSYLQAHRLERKIKNLQTELLIMPSVQWPIPTVW